MASKKIYRAKGPIKLKKISKITKPVPTKITRQIKHLENLIDLSLKAAGDPNPALRDLFLAQAMRLQSDLDLIKELANALP